MTLITYPTRVHFADDVLEEALRAELERIDARCVMLVRPASSGAPGLTERVRSGFPVAATVGELILGQDRDSAIDLNDLAELGAEMADSADVPDVIVAFGTARAIELGRKCRRLLADRLGHRLPFFAIPGADGLPNPCTRNIESWSSGLPTVLICDPTVTLGTAAPQNQRAAVLSMVRCVEAYLAAAYNPPADGIAMGGIHRCIATLPCLGGSAGIDLQREVMAGCLNAALSQEKGGGLTLALAGALATATHIEEADAARLLLPEVIRRHPVERAKEDALARLFGTAAGERLVDAMTRTLAMVSLPDRLSDMGVTRGGLDRAAQSVARSDHKYNDARLIMDAVF